MLQQIIALMVILAFIARLALQRRKQNISAAEFWLWLLIWLAAGTAIIFIRSIDQLAAGLGFSSRGIDILLYLAVAVLFYMLFKYRLRLAKIEKQITRLTRQAALNNKDE